MSIYDEPAMKADEAREKLENLGGINFDDGYYVWRRGGDNLHECDWIRCMTVLIIDLAERIDALESE